MLPILSKKPNPLVNLTRPYILAMIEQNYSYPEDADPQSIKEVRFWGNASMSDDSLVRSEKWTLNSHGDSISVEAFDVNADRSNFGDQFTTSDSSVTNLDWESAWDKTRTTWETDEKRIEEVWHHQEYEQTTYEGEEITVQLTRAYTDSLSTTHIARASYGPGEETHLYGNAGEEVGKAVVHEFRHVSGEPSKYCWRLIDMEELARTGERLTLDGDIPGVEQEKSCTVINAESSIPTEHHTIPPRPKGYPENAEYTAIDLNGDGNFVDLWIVPEEMAHPFDHGYEYAVLILTTAHSTTVKSECGREIHWISTGTVLRMPHIYARTHRELMVLRLA